MNKSPTYFIDFTEIGNDSRFEKFAEHFLEDMGFNIDTPPSFGPDRKRDLVVSEPSLVSKRGLRWLVSCKYYGSRIGQDDDEANINKLYEHDCDGFMFVYSHEPTSSLLDSVEAVCKRSNKPYKFFTGWNIENALMSFTEHTRTFRYFFPKSFRIINDLKKEPKCECKFHTISYGGPLLVLAYKRHRDDVPHYKMVCNECISDIYDDLNRDCYSWSTTVLLEEF
ncbi:restriction endonuclease [Vibrio ziniensis]|uniref:Restriction endonuclease n=1 Tax=Vibrio ziniensis TaxID=2711221 RepID=A0A6G7CKS8_9VIBR|nr:restriction endonuclease [Vibrio ziniensis]QIH42727.1 restriction endonuclease [Vibrio ziniensis]